MRTVLFVSLVSLLASLVFCVAFTLQGCGAPPTVVDGGLSDEGPSDGGDGSVRRLHVNRRDAATVDATLVLLR